MKAVAPAIVVAIRESLPIRGPEFEFALSAGTADEPSIFATDEGDVFASIELTVFTTDEHGAREILDVKQQNVCFVPRAHTNEVDRAVAFVRGACRAVPSIARSFGGDVAMCMPFDLVPVVAFEHASLRNEDDFAAALSDPARIQKWRDESFRTDVREGLAQWGLEDKVDEFLALRRDAIYLDEHESLDGDEADPDALAIGETRFGGEPDVPPSFEWPRAGDRPLTFVGQLDLDDLAEFSAARELPSKGVLSFFYDGFPENGPNGLDFAPRVFHFANRAELERRTTPEGGDRRPGFSVAVGAIADMMPPLESPYYEAMLPEETELAFRRSLAAQSKPNAPPLVDPLAGLSDFLMQWYQSELSDGEAHRVLGYATPYQGDPLVDVEIHSQGGSWGRWDDASVDALRARRAARRWRSLLQVSAMIDGTLLLEQDCGSLYFLVPEDALAVHDWSRVRCVMQCS